MKNDKEIKQVLCAIYTRVSTSEGLEQAFSSLDNQRESAESYILSQKSEGWTALPERYDDGGYTGANTDRPALLKLIADIKNGKINCVVVYKVDRLSRSLLDFSQLLEFFDHMAHLSRLRMRRPGVALGRSRSSQRPSGVCDRWATVLTRWPATDLPTVRLTPSR